MEKSQDILSKIIIHNKYSKYLPSLKRREIWSEIVERNKNMHYEKFKTILTKEDHSELEQVYKSVLDKKILPSMRGLQFSGKPIEINNSRIYNCCYLPIDDYRAFSEIMFLLLSGCGVGYSVQNNHISKLPIIRKPLKWKRYLVGDSIEGWADAVKMLFKAYLGSTSTGPKFDFRDIRPKGANLITSGGKAPGPEPLKEGLFHIKKILDRKEDGEQLSSLEIHDIICHIADTVLSGGIRRAALVSLFDFTDTEMLTCKFGKWWEQNPQRGRANNSAVILRYKIREKEFFDLWKKIEWSNSGEPGIYFTNSANVGSNPCMEVSLKPFSFCNLVEVNVSNIESQEDLNDRVKKATIISTLQASYTDFHYLRDIWQKTTEKDSLIGVGMTGIASGEILKYDLKEPAEIVKTTNQLWAKKIGINPASRTTTIKPSGTTSLVLGTSSGIHGWHDKYYLRRIRLSKNEALTKYLEKNIPELIEDDVFKPHIQSIVSIPQKSPEGAILREEPVIELLDRIKKFNVEWIQEGHIKGENYNNVSATISIKKDEWEEVGKWMWKNRKTFSGLSVLPYDGGSYIQAPFESITEEEYNEKTKNLKNINLLKITEEEDNTELQGEISCGGGQCEIF